MPVSQHAGDVVPATICMPGLERIAVTTCCQRRAGRLDPHLLTDEIM